MTRARAWAVPSAILLVAALFGGAWLQRRPAGGWTRRVLAAATAFCPAAVPVPRRLPIVADGARAIDAAAWRRWRGECGVQPRRSGAGEPGRRRVRP